MRVREEARVGRVCAFDKRNPRYVMPRYQNNVKTIPPDAITPRNSASLVCCTSRAESTLAPSPFLPTPTTYYELVKSLFYWVANRNYCALTVWKTYSTHTGACRKTSFGVRSQNDQNGPKMWRDFQMINFQETLCTTGLVSLNTNLGWEYYNLKRRIEFGDPKRQIFY